QTCALPIYAPASAPEPEASASNPSDFRAWTRVRTAKPFVSGPKPCVNATRTRVRDFEPEDSGARTRVRKFEPEDSGVRTRVRESEPDDSWTRTPVREQ